MLKNSSSFHAWKMVCAFILRTFNFLKHASISAPFLDWFADSDEERENKAPEKSVEIIEVSVWEDAMLRF